MMYLYIVLFFAATLGVGYLVMKLSEYGEFYIKNQIEKMTEEQKDSQYLVEYSEGTLGRHSGYYIQNKSTGKALHVFEAFGRPKVVEYHDISHATFYSSPYQARRVIQKLLN